MSSLPLSPLGDLDPRHYLSGENSLLNSSSDNNNGNNRFGLSLVKVALPSGKPGAEGNSF